MASETQQGNALSTPATPAAQKSSETSSTIDSGNVKQYEFKCPRCESCLKNKKQYAKHMKSHIEKGESINHFKSLS